MQLPLYAFHLEQFTAEVEARAPELADEVERYDMIPSVFLARTDGTRAKEIATLPGVISFRPTHESERRIVWHLNQLLLLEEVHRTTLRVNGIAKAVIALGAEGAPPYPVLCTDREPPIQLDPSIHLPTRLTIFGALNLSLQPDHIERFDAEDAVNLATLSASRFVPVVLAAGNKGDANPGPTIAGWAEAPWTISVGAAADAKGTHLADYSLVGSPNHPMSGPTVIAHGVDDDSADEGTSFAAPRVADELAILTAFCLTLRHFRQRLDKAGDVEGIPVVSLGYVDISLFRGQGNEHGWHVAGLRRPAHPLPALPTAGIDQEALKTVVSALEASGTSIGLLPTPERLRRLLVASAQPVPGYQTFEVGAGFISQATTLRFLNSFSGADLGEFFGEPRPAAPDLQERLSKITLLDDKTLPSLMKVWRDSMLKWGGDLTNFSPQDRPTLEFLAETPDP